METRPPTTQATATTTIATTTPTTTTPPSSTTTTLPAFSATVSPIDAAELVHSWHEACPVGPDVLVRIDLLHHDFAGGVQTGRLVMHADHADEIVAVFSALFDAGFPLTSVIPIGELGVGAEDEPDYANTSGFHCRFVEGTTRWSEHAFGRAIDVNPHLNPLVRGSYVWPSGAGDYVDRGRGDPGMIIEGGPVVAAFDAIGWGWGGRWRTLKDYHHFSSSGR